MLKQFFSLSSYFRYSAFIIYMVIITTLSLRDDLPDPVQKALQFDLLLHFGAYSVFSFLLLWAMQPHKSLFFWSIIILSALYGTMMEYFQFMLTNTRVLSLIDITANLLGVISGVIMFMTILRFIMVQNR